MGKRTWIKIYCDKWLNGSMRERSPFDRGIWIDLLVLAGNGSYGDTGFITLTKKYGVSDHDMASILGISKNKWKACKRLFKDLHMIEVGNRNNVIRIVNWDKYQSEYNRQKTYKDKPDIEGTLFSPSRAREKEKEKEKENQKQTSGKNQSNIESPNNVPTVKIDEQLKRTIFLKIELLKKKNYQAEKLVTTLINNKALPEDLDFVLAKVLKYSPDKPIAYALRILDEYQQQRSAKASNRQSDSDKEADKAGYTELFKHLTKGRKIE